MTTFLSQTVAQGRGYRAIEPWVLITAAALSSFGVLYSVYGIIAGILLGLLWEAFSPVDNHKASIVISLSMVVSGVATVLVGVGIIAGLGGTVTGVITYVILRRRQSF